MKQGHDPRPVLCISNASRIIPSGWAPRVKGPGGSKLSNVVFLLDELEGPVQRLPGQEAAHVHTGKILGNYSFKK